MEVGGVGWLGWASHSLTTSKIPDLNELPNQADKLRHKKSGLLLQSQGFTAQLTACTIYNLQHHINKTYYYQTHRYCKDGRDYVRVRNIGDRRTEAGVTITNGTINYLGSQSVIVAARAAAWRDNKTTIQRGRAGQRTLDTASSQFRLGKYLSCCSSI